MLTTTEAADFPGVARPYLTRLLQIGKRLYHHKDHRHHVPVTHLEAINTRCDLRLCELTDQVADEEAGGARSPA